MTDQTPITRPAIRHDGWTPARVTQFLDHLASDGSVRAACSRVGMSREAAYRLRRRDALFARAWNAALVLARAASAEVLECRAIHGVEEEIWFRGELVGTRRKYDSRLLLAHMARLDSIAESERAGEDAARFDELIALTCQVAEPREDLLEDGLPPDRETAIAIAGIAAMDDWEDEPDERTDDDCYAARDRAQAEAAVRWDAWFADVRSSVDGLLQAPCAEPAESVCTLSELSTSPADAVEQAKAQDDVTVVQPVSPSPEIVAETSEAGKPEREPRFDDFRASKTPWPDYCAARKAFHQKTLAARAAKS